MQKALSKINHPQLKQGQI